MINYDKYYSERNKYEEEKIQIQSTLSIDNNSDKGLTWDTQIKFKLFVQKRIKSYNYCLFVLFSLTWHIGCCFDKIVYLLHINLCSVSACIDLLVGL